MRVSLGRFVAAAALLVGGSTLLPAVLPLERVRRATAFTAWWVARATGMETTLIGSQIVTRSRVLDVAITCLPLGLVAVYLAAVVATRASWGRIVLGVIVGVAALFTANITRVLVGVWAAQAHPEVFDALHAGVLQLLLPVVAACTWLAWAHAATKAKS